MDFVSEWMEVQLPTLDITHEYWTMYFYGSVMALGLGTRVVLISPDERRLRYVIRRGQVLRDRTASCPSKGQ